MQSEFFMNFLKLQIELRKDSHAESVAEESCGLFSWGDGGLVEFLHSLLMAYQV
jgi:hypothetical protein